MGRFEGKVAFITGGARGQGRTHALRLAEEGADVIVIDIAEQIASVPYDMGTEADLAETVRLVEGHGRRIFSAKADVRDYDGLKAALDAGVAELGRLDVVLASAGILSFTPLEHMPEEMWQDMIDVNMTGVWHTTKTAIPHLRAAGGGAIVITNSADGLQASPNIGHYGTAKHGLVGLMRTLALEVARDNIRVNSVHPSTANTDMVTNQAVYDLFSPDAPQEERTKELMQEKLIAMTPLGIPWLEQIDITNAVLWLASDEARYLTGVSLPVDPGTLLTHAQW